MKTGEWYDAKLVEDTVEQLSELAGTFGYAFADVQPDFTRNREELTMSVNFVLRQAPRVYVERVDVNGNTRSEEHTSEIQSLMRISYAVFCLKKKKQER